MKVAIENTDGLTQDEATAVKAAASGLRNSDSLEHASAELRAWFPDWFTYDGGSHVALHRNARDDRRVLMVYQA